jgi:hypothetical protein
MRRKPLIGKVKSIKRDDVFKSHPKKNRTHKPNITHLTTHLAAARSWCIYICGKNGALLSVEILQGRGSATLAHGASMTRCLLCPSEIK